MALGISTVLGIMGTTAMLYTSHNSSLASRSSADARAFSYAEAGINDALGVLNLPTNNALDPCLLHPATALSGTTCASYAPVRVTFSGGYVLWSGTLSQLTSTWTIAATGYVRNPTGAAGQVKRTLTVSEHITPTLTQPLNNPAWNYVMALRTGNQCDMTIGQSVNISAPLYVYGNLCFTNTAWMSSGSLVVKGHLTLNNPQNSVGLANARISDAHIGNGCDYQRRSQSPCTGGATVNVFANQIDAGGPSITPPTVSWDGWYKAASPGPNFPCVAGKSSASNTWPTFDTGDGLANNSVTAIWNLTPATAYDCWTPGGELKWNPTTRRLTVSGTIYIDGSATVNNGAVNTYVGQGALYLSGTFLVKNSSLCAVSSCTATGWDPNQALFVVVANGNGSAGGAQSQVPSGDSIQIVSGSFQGGLYGTNAVETDTTANVDGPLLGSTVILGQSVNSSFPFIMTVPVATPGNPLVYAQPDTPSGFVG
jgi:hypothetical protein